jgi:S1-C subfamily serine protease
MSGKTIVPAALLAALSTPALALDNIELFQEARPSLVQLAGVGAGGRLYLGSGVALSDGTIVTNCHVTQRAKKVQFLGGAYGQLATRQISDVSHDLCVLHFQNMGLRPAVIGSSRNLKVGDTVFAVGFNAGASLSFRRGQVAELFEHEGAMVIRTTAAFTHGASGGGLFDQNGKLVGILTFFRVAPGETSYFAVPVEWLEAVQQGPAKDIEPLAGVPFWADRVERQPSFLQAGALESDGRWAELAVFAKQWTDANPEDAQAWMALGKANLYLGDRATAEAAFKRAVDLGITYPANLWAPQDGAGQ